MTKHAFKARLVRRLLDTLSYTGKPQTRQQRLELTKAMALKLLEKMNGPLLPVHLMHLKKNPEITGYLVKAWIEADSSFWAGFEIDDAYEAGREALRGIRNGELKEVSLGHLHSENRPLEISLVLKGARPGTQLFPANAAESSSDDSESGPSVDSFVDLGDNVDVSMGAESAEVGGQTESPDLVQAAFGLEDIEFVSGKKMSGLDYLHKSSGGKKDREEDGDEDSGKRESKKGKKKARDSDMTDVEEEEQERRESKYPPERKERVEKKNQQQPKDREPFRKGYVGGKQKDRNDSTADRGDQKKNKSRDPSKLLMRNEKELEATEQQLRNAKRHNAELMEQLRRSKGKSRQSADDGDLDGDGGGAGAEDDAQDEEAGSERRPASKKRREQLRQGEEQEEIGTGRERDSEDADMQNEPRSSKLRMGAEDEESLKKALHILSKTGQLSTTAKDALIDIIQKQEEGKAALLEEIERSHRLNQQLEKTSEVEKQKLEQQLEPYKKQIAKNRENLSSLIDTLGEVDEMTPRERKEMKKAALSGKLDALTEFPQLYETLQEGLASRHMEQKKAGESSGAAPMEDEQEGYESDHNRVNAGQESEDEDAGMTPSTSNSLPQSKRLTHTKNRSSSSSSSSSGNNYLLDKMASLNDIKRKQRESLARIREIESERRRHAGKSDSSSSSSSLARKKTEKKKERKERDSNRMRDDDDEEIERERAEESDEYDSKDAKRGNKNRGSRSRSREQEEEEEDEEDRHAKRLYESTTEKRVRFGWKFGRPSEEEDDQEQQDRDRSSKSGKDRSQKDRKVAREAANNSRNKRGSSSSSSSSSGERDSKYDPRDVVNAGYESSNVTLDDLLPRNGKYGAREAWDATNANSMNLCNIYLGEDRGLWAPGSGAKMPFEAERQVVGSASLSSRGKRAFPSILRSL